MGMLSSKNGIAAGFGGRYSCANGAGMATLWALALALLLTGCAVPKAFHVNVDTAAAERPALVFPPAPEVARYRYLGQLQGEANFKPISETRNFLKDALNWLVGLFDDQPLTLQRPQAGVVDEAGRIYVTDAGLGAVWVFDVVAGELLKWEKADGLVRLSNPVGITIGPGGDILVADAKLGYVVRLDAKGEPRGLIGKGLLQRPTGLAYDRAGRRVYVADTGTHDIKVFDDGGQLVKTIGRRGEAEGEFNFPTHLAFAGGELYIADTLNSRIQVLSEDGATVKARFGSRGVYVGDLVRPKGVAVDSQGNIYVIESLHDYMLVFNRRGELLLPLGGTSGSIGQFYLPAGIWIDKSDRVFVADMFNGRVPVFQFLGSDSRSIK